MTSELHVAIIGAGPAGIFAADLLKKNTQNIDVSVDLFETLPAPYGLVRYGVAPDHPRIKGVVNTLASILDSGNIRLLGNVTYGTDITLNDLQKHYHAVIFATGADNDAKLDIPGIDLAGSFGASEFVSWYDGHPDAAREWDLSATEAAVIGNGNVALDVARILVKKPEDLLSTEIPDNVFDGLNQSRITDVHVFGRRGPMQVKFTPLELREMGELNDVDIILNPDDFEYDEASLRAKEVNKQLMVIDRIFRSWLDRPSGEASRRLHFHFYARPDEVLGEDHVSALRVERTEPDHVGSVTGTGIFQELPMQAIYRAVGYFSSPADQIPFDSYRGVIPNVEGRVMQPDVTSPDQFNEVLPGVYVTGWVKRGPIGLIGSTKSDAMETVENLLSDAGNWWTPDVLDRDAIPELLRQRGVDFTDLAGWHALDATEIALGQSRSRERIKLVSREEMLEAAQRTDITDKN